MGMDICGGFCESGLGLGWACGFGGGVGGGIGAEEVGVSSQGVVGLAVYEEADGGDFGECGVERADHGLDRKGFDLDA